MDHVLPLLIEGAEAGRDRLAARLREATGQAQQAGATLTRLSDFRAGCVARSPVTRGGPVDVQSLVDHHRFVGRLDEAIAMQTHEERRRQDMAALAQARLAEGQRKLLAFQTLAKRRAAARDLKDARRGQREADEFAARAVRLAQERA